jgi:hypothetical protein
MNETRLNWHILAELFGVTHKQLIGLVNNMSRACPHESRDPPNSKNYIRWAAEIGLPAARSQVDFLKSPRWPQLSVGAQAIVDSIEPRFISRVKAGGIAEVEKKLKAERSEASSRSAETRRRREKEAAADSRPELPEPLLPEPAQVVEVALEKLRSYGSEPTESANNRGYSLAQLIDSAKAQGLSVVDMADRVVIYKPMKVFDVKSRFEDVLILKEQGGDVVAMVRPFHGTLKAGDSVLANLDDAGDVRVSSIVKA